MTDERWQEVTEKIRNAFPDHEHGEESLLGGKGTVEFYVFSGPKGKLKLERTKRPRIVGERGISSHRIGSDTTIEKVYSENEMVDFVKVYQWNGGQETWVPIEDDSFFGTI